MASDGRTQIALDAIRTRTELFRSAVAEASDQVRGLLAGTGNVAEDQSVALGKFAQGRVNIDRFASFAPKGCANRCRGGSSHSSRAGSVEILACRG